ncbi:MAG: hypothetical protein AMXMBFR51_29390 [Ignavibacteriota bacterium]
MIKVDDFVILRKNRESIVKDSVGIVKSVSSESVRVFFIGPRVNVTLPLSAISFLDIHKTGKPHPKKICNICHILKNDPRDFDINQTDAKGGKTTRPSCKKCRVEIDGAPLKPAEKKRLEQIKPKHFFICPICQKGSIPDVTASLVKDHDHTSGKAREWICDSCNTGLGRFKDDVELLNRAIKYLKKHSQNN